MPSEAHFWIICSPAVWSLFTQLHNNNFYGTHCWYWSPSRAIPGRDCMDVMGWNNQWSLGYPLMMCQFLIWKTLQALPWCVFQNIIFQCNTVTTGAWMRDDHAWMCFNDGECTDPSAYSSQIQMFNPWLASSSWLHVHGVGILSSGTPEWLCGNLSYVPKPNREWLCGDLYFPYS